MKLAGQEETEEGRQRKREELLQGLNFAPLNVKSSRGRVYYQSPVIMIRSAIHGVKPTRNLMPPRYDALVHCDLWEPFVSGAGS